MATPSTWNEAKAAVMKILGDKAKIPDPKGRSAPERQTRTKTFLKYFDAHSYNLMKALRISDARQLAHSFASSHTTAP